jgi:hypothetical protein
MQGVLTYSIFTTGQNETIEIRKTGGVLSYTVNGSDMTLEAETDGPWTEEWL